MQVTLGEMQVVSRLFRIVMTQQNLNGAQVSTILENASQNSVEACEDEHFSGGPLVGRPAGTHAKRFSYRWGDRRNGRGCPETARLLVFGVSGANAHEVLQAI